MVDWEAFSGRESGLVVVVLVLFGTAVYLLRAYRRERRKLQRMEDCRQQERTGRIKAERQLKQAKGQIQLLEAQPAAASSEQRPSGRSLPAGVLMRPIGTVESVWPRRNGTPRQACLVPSSRASVTLHPWVQPTQSLDSLSEFSHVWVIFLFHFNTNLHLDHVRALVRPPRLGRSKVGMYATRTPHRPNNVGMSLCRLVAVEKNVVKLAGVDLVSGTPVIDIKPYVHQYDSVACSPSSSSSSSSEQPCNTDYRTPAWLDEPLQRRRVVFTEQAEAVLAAHWTVKRSGKPGRPAKSLYTSAADVRQFLVDALSYDIRGVRQKEAAALPTYKVYLDVLEVLWSTAADDTVTVEALAVVDPATIPYPVEEDTIEN